MKNKQNNEGQVIDVGGNNCFLYRYHHLLDPLLLFSPTQEVSPQRDTYRSREAHSVLPGLGVGSQHDKEWCQVALDSKVGAGLSCFC